MPSQAYTPRRAFSLPSEDGPTLCAQVQSLSTGAGGPLAGCNVLYVHGSTFGADLSVFYRLDGYSWADALNALGATVWAFDFAGYGLSERYAADSSVAPGRLAECVAQLGRVVELVRQASTGQPLALLGHSFGGSVAAAYAAEANNTVQALVLFAPVLRRDRPPLVSSPSLAPPFLHITQWAQYRRFVEDVPRGHAQVLNEAHFAVWAQAYLASDAAAQSHVPPAVCVPGGPLLDVRALWSGQALWGNGRIPAPTLLVRGTWDQVCTDDDAQSLLASVGSAVSEGATVEGATHLMHLEVQRHTLYRRVAQFLEAHLDKTL